MIILNKEGILKTSDGYDSISLDAGTYSIGELPYFLKNSKIREIIYILRGVSFREKNIRDLA